MNEVFESDSVPAIYIDAPETETSYGPSWPLEMRQSRSKRAIQVLGGKDSSQKAEVMTHAAIVQVTERPPFQAEDGGPQPTSPLHSLRVSSIPVIAARNILVRHHYLHSLPGGTKLAFGVFLDDRLLGALTLGAGPVNACRQAEGAVPDDCLTLTRLWLSDDLPKNSESRVISVVLRALRRNTNIKFLLSYADPSRGHLGVIYQATGWLYTGLSEAMPLYDLGDGKARHSRSLSHAYGSHSTEHFRRHGVDVKLIAQAAKHKYVYFVDRSWRSRLSVPILPYPKRGHEHGSC